jgi:hypothetical protein
MEHLEPSGGVALEPRAVQTGRGAGWLKDGFALFKAAPGAWIVNLLIFVVLLLVVGSIPLVQVVTSLFMPVLMAGWMLGCRALDNGESMQVAHLFAGFKERTGALVAAGAVYLGLTFVIGALFVALAFLLGFGDELVSSNPAEPSASMLIAILLVIALSIPVVMAYWFVAPLLIFNRELAVFEAYRLSFTGCLRNIAPFLVFGLVAAVLSILATVPMALGWLVLGPVLIAANYVAYREIYVTEGPVDPVVQ